MGFNETIERIIKGAGSKPSKKAALMKLGILPNEANVLLSMYMPAGESTKKAVYTFGVELECNVNYGAVTRSSNLFRYITVR